MTASQSKWSMEQMAAMALSVSCGPPPGAPQSSDPSGDATPAASLSHSSASSAGRSFGRTPPHSISS